MPNRSSTPTPAESLDAKGTGLDLATMRSLGARTELRLRPDLSDMGGIGTYNNIGHAVKVLRFEIPDSLDIRVKSTVPGDQPWAQLEGDEERFVYQETCRMGDSLLEAVTAELAKNVAQSEPDTLTGIWSSAPRQTDNGGGTDTPGTGQQDSDMDMDAAIAFIYRNYAISLATVTFEDLETLAIVQAHQKVQIHAQPHTANASSTQDDQSGPALSQAMDSERVMQPQQSMGRSTPTGSQSSQNLLDSLQILQMKFTSPSGRMVRCRWSVPTSASVDGRKVVAEAYWIAGTKPTQTINLSCNLEARAVSER